MRYDKKPLVEFTNRINISSTIRKLELDLSDAFRNSHNKEIDLNSESDVKLFTDLIKSTTTINQTIGDKTTKSNSVEIAYTPSNLGRGFIFWFVCNRCKSKVRDIYCPSNSEDFLCRKCHRLAYTKQNKKSDREVAKLLTDPLLMARYMSSGSWKQNFFALEAMFMREEIEKKAIEKVNSFQG